MRNYYLSNCCWTRSRGALWVISLLISLSVIAQPVLTREEVLAKYGLRDVSGVHSNWSKTVKGLPVISDLGLRTETNDLLFKSLDMQIRVGWNSRKERKASKQWGYLVGQERSLYLRVHRLERVREVYRRMILLYYSAHQMSRYDTLLGLLKQKEEIYQKMVAAGQSIDVEKWFDNQNDRRDAQLKHKEHESMLRYLSGQFGLDNLTGIDPLFKHWISLDRMERLVFSKGRSFEQSPLLLLQNAKLDISRNEWKMAAAKQSNWLDFIQLKYSTSKQFDFRKEVSIGANFNIPLAVLSRFDAEKARLKALEAQEKRQVFGEQWTEEYQQAIYDFKHKLSNYRSYAGINEDIGMKRALGKYKTMPSIEPIVILDIAIKVTNDRIKMGEMKRDVLLAYLKVLYLEGRLVQSPYRDYLSEDLVIISTGN